MRAVEINWNEFGGKVGFVLWLIPTILAVIGIWIGLRALIGLAPTILDSFAIAIGLK